MTNLPIEEEAKALSERFASVNRAQFARDFQVKGGQAMIYQHINGLRPISLEAALSYARGFKCSLNEISARLAQELADAARYLEPPTAGQEKFDKNVAPVALGQRAIPVISAIQAGAMKEIQVPYSVGDGYASVFVDDSYSQWAFGLEIEGDSMLPDYRSGDIVIIEPEWEPRPGECVAAKNGKEEATFKKYRQRGISDDGTVIFELVPLNEDYPTVRSDQTPLTIIGVMAEHRRKTRRR